MVRDMQTYRAMEAVMQSIPTFSLVTLALALAACGAPPADTGGGCVDDLDCARGESCVDERCVAMPAADAGPAAMPDAAPPDGGPAASEACDGFDDDLDDRVDEGCGCTPGQTQACRPWREGEAPPCALEGVQTCEGIEFGEWGACEQPPPDPAADLCPTWILGAEADHRLAPGRGGGIGDVDQDGAPDLLAPDATATHVIAGGPSLQGRTIDLRTEPARSRIVGATNQPGARLADVDGDGHLDIVRGAGGRAVLVAWGGRDLPAVLEEVDGARMTRLVGGGASSGDGNAGAADLDGDGRAEVLLSGSNSTVFGATSHGLTLWFGDAARGVERPAGATLAIGVGTVGEGSQANHSVAGTFGDFDADGYPDLTAYNGAANDRMIIPYVVRVIPGRSERGWTSMNEGLTVTGGSGSGVIPARQSGDLDGDGIDDLVLIGQGRRDVYVIWGGSDLAGPLATGSLAERGFSVRADAIRPDTVGVGDVDGDGADDLVVPIESDAGDLAIVWGGARRTEDMDPMAGGATLVTIPDHAQVMSHGAYRSVAVGDLDGDGLGDVVVSMPYAETTNGVRSGAGVVLFGNRLYGAHNPDLIARRRGVTPIAATDGPDRIASGLEADLVRGVGAGDVVLAGAGDDRIELVAAGFGRIDGGPGVDTVALVGEVTLDLRASGRRALVEVERFDLADGGAQTFAARDGDLSMLSTRTRALVVEGGPEDRVVLGGAWEADAPAMGMVSYRRGAMSVSVSESVSVSVEP